MSREPPGHRLARLVVGAPGVPAPNHGCHSHSEPSRRIQARTPGGSTEQTSDAGRKTPVSWAHPVPPPLPASQRGGRLGPDPACGSQVCTEGAAPAGGARQRLPPLWPSLLQAAPPSWRRIQSRSREAGRPAGLHPQRQPAGVGGGRCRLRPLAAQSGWDRGRVPR